METNVSNGRRLKKDPRETLNWVERLSLKATGPGDPFIIAAIVRALTTNLTPKLSEQIRSVAVECLRDHKESEKRVGAKSRIGRDIRKASKSLE